MFIATLRSQHDAKAARSPGSVESVEFGSLKPVPLWPSASISDADASFGTFDTVNSGFNGNFNLDEAGWDFWDESIRDGQMLPSQ